jgi:hypothetical protein
MNIVMLDDSVAFDGFTAATKPLGGAEKAFAALAGALAKAGHTVTVTNRCKHALMAEGARWRPWDSTRPQEADVLIALKNPELLGSVRRVDSRILFVPGDPKFLGNAHNADLLASYAPRLLFLTERQAQEYGGRLSVIIAPPGVTKAFFSEKKGADPYPDANHPAIPMDEEDRTEEQEEELPPPHAVVTTHPLHGLSKILELWRDKIHPAKGDAKLTVYSAVLAKGVEGEDVPDAIRPVLELVISCSSSNVEVSAPKGDRVMAEAYRRSRVHLYPGHAKDFACWTLRDSQATGLPAVARSLGGVEDVVDNGQTGFVVPDDDAFANVALQLLTDDGVYTSFQAAAAAVNRRRTWATAADIVTQLWL